MKSNTFLSAVVLALIPLFLSAAEPVLKFTAPATGPRTAGMCGPTHDEEVIYGLGSDGKEHFFAVGTDVRVPYGSTYR